MSKRSYSFLVLFLVQSFVLFSSASSDLEKKDLYDLFHQLERSKDNARARVLQCLGLQKSKQLISGCVYSGVWTAKKTATHQLRNTFHQSLREAFPIDSVIDVAQPITAHSQKSIPRAQKVVHWKEGKVVSVHVDGHIRVWDTDLHVGDQLIRSVRLGNAKPKGPYNKIYCLAKMQDGTFAVGVNKPAELQIWDFDRDVGSDCVAKLKARRGIFRELVVRDDDLVFSICFYDKNVRVWEPKKDPVPTSFTSHFQVHSDASVKSLALLKDQLLATFDHQEGVKIWHIPDARVQNFVCNYNGFKSNVHLLLHSVLGELVVEDTRKKAITFWDVKRERAGAARVIERNRRVENVQVVGVCDNQLVCSHDSELLSISEIGMFKSRFRARSAVCSCACLPNGAMVLAGPDCLRTYLTPEYLDMVQQSGLSDKEKRQMIKRFGHKAARMFGSPEESMRRQQFNRDLDEIKRKRKLVQQTLAAIVDAVDLAQGGSVKRANKKK